MSRLMQNAPPVRTLPTPARSNSLARKCGCGLHTAHCEKCSGHRRDDASPVRHASLRPGEQVHAAARGVGYDSTFGGGLPHGYDFTRLSLNGLPETSNGNDEDEARESVDDSPQADAGSGPTTAPAPKPTGTRVDTTTSYTQEALKAGYLSGLGIIARMQVLPDSANWDGKEVVESVAQSSSTCPDTLTNPGPCHGSSHFPIGSAMRGRGVRPEQPAMHNRFYDIHTSQSTSVSFLHDPARNPKGLNACESVCRQDYSFDGVVIGSHSIRRQFRKGKVDGHDVTVIDVTKTDLAPAASGSKTPPSTSPTSQPGDAGTKAPSDGGTP